MARSNALYFSMKSSLKSPIKSHADKAAAIKAAGIDGHIFDKKLEIQMKVTQAEDGSLFADIPEKNGFDFKRNLIDSNMINQYY